MTDYKSSKKRKTAKTRKTTKILKSKKLSIINDWISDEKDEGRKYLSQMKEMVYLLKKR
jgi:hypothetical protein